MAIGIVVLPQMYSLSANTKLSVCVTLGVRHFGGAKLSSHTFLYQIVIQLNMSEREIRIQQGLDYLGSNSEGPQPTEIHITRTT